MLTKYVNSYTDGSRRFWQREVHVEGKYSHDEKWCVVCKYWRRVAWVGGERHCSICDALQEWRNNSERFDEYEDEWERAFPIKRKCHPTSCGCGRLMDDEGPCDKCYRIIQETEESLR